MIHSQLHFFSSPVKKKIRMDAGESGFNELMKKIEEDGLTQQIQLFLSVLIPQKLVARSIDILYNEPSIKCIIAQKTRRSFWTISSKKNKYIIFSDINTKFCSCKSYENNVVRKGKCPLCKHILTILICEALQKKGDMSQFSIEEVDDTSFSEIIASDVFFLNFRTKE